MNIRDFYFSMKKNLPAEIDLFLQPDPKGEWLLVGAMYINGSTYFSATEYKEADYQLNDEKLQADVMIVSFKHGMLLEEAADV